LEKNPRLPSKKRDPVAFEAQKVKIEALQEKARAGEIELAYLDEAEGYFKKSGITLEFLPPYSPELNRIEKLWNTMKHHWIEIKERTSQVLLNEITHILENFGFQFRFHFYGK
jgi:transposase